MIWQRLKNLWKLSDFEPNVDTQELPIGTKVIQSLIKKPIPSASFIPYTKIDPIKKIVNENA